ncbi:MAG: hypothetical protein JW902_05070 [Syntrophaceae bacterium]|nr:hypothetical protein [Syntrophaceae bacterium]
MQHSDERTLAECLFLLVKMFNDVLDRLDIATDRADQTADDYGELFDQSKRFFIDMRTEFMKGIITAEVDKYRAQHNFTYAGRGNAGKDVSGKKIHFTINAGCQGSDQEVAAHKR